MIKPNILIPMAGLGSRFADAGYELPKPLIDVNGIPMIKSVVDSIDIKGNYIFIVQLEHFKKYNLKNILKDIAPNCEIVIIDGLTEGAASTTLAARQYIDNDQPLIIANSDQIIKWNSKKFLRLSKAFDGLIATFEETEQNPKWSYSETIGGLVLRVAEKEVISNRANVGIYGFKKGSDYVKYAEQMIEKDIRVNNEFYIAPIYNELIADKKVVFAFDVEKMYGVGTPEDLKVYLENNFS